MSTVADPYYERFLDAVAMLDAEGPAGDPAYFARFKAMQSRIEGYTPPHVDVIEAEAGGPHGPIPVRVYTPGPGSARRPVLVWCHGGGWARGDLDMGEADGASREICARAEAVVVSVDYRLAVGSVHYPVPLDDVVSAFTWASTAAKSFGGSPDHMVLGGASAGANLSAGAAMRLRDDGRELPSSLVLLYPLLHPELPAPSKELADKLAKVTPQMRCGPDILEAFVENYLGGPLSSADAYAMPGLGRLDGFPKTLIVNCEYDGLRASGEKFAQDLARAGSEVSVLTAPWVGHGYVDDPRLVEAQRTLGEVAAWVRGS